MQKRGKKEKVYNNKVEIQIISTLFFYDLLVIYALTFIIIEMIKYIPKGAVIYGTSS